MRHLLLGLALCLPLPALAEDLADLVRRTCAGPMLSGRAPDLSGLAPLSGGPIRVWIAPGTGWTVTLAEGPPGYCSVAFAEEPAGAEHWDRLAAMLVATGYTALPDCAPIEDGARIDAFRGPIGDLDGETLVASVSGTPDGVEEVLFLRLPARAALLPCEG